MAYIDNADLALTEWLGYRSVELLVGRYKMPVVPGRVMLNGWLAGNDVSSNSTYHLSWAWRSRDYPGVVTEYDPLDIAQAGVTYNIWVKQGSSVKITQYGVTGNQLDIDGTLFEPGELEVLIEAVADAGNSIVTKTLGWSITI